VSSQAGGESGMRSLSMEDHTGRRGLVVVEEEEEDEDE
jgi:hypothetical protein